MQICYFVLSKRMIRTLFLLLYFLNAFIAFGQSKALVFQTDFGMKDGAVAAMKGVAYSIAPDLHLFDLTHEIPPFNIWEGAYRLGQAAPYWPSGTVFVSVVDPGVGSERKSIVLKTKSGHFFVTPDNGTVTLVAEMLGVEEIREIDEARNRLKNSQASYTFHGRDVYAYTGARLAGGIISFEEVGARLEEIVRLPYQKAVCENGIIKGTIDILDIQYGNIWTNVDDDILSKLDVKFGDKINVKIFGKTRKVYEGDIVYARTFADVKQGEVLGYLNSLMKFSIGINQGNFAEKFKTGSGPEWKIELSRSR